MVKIKNEENMEDIEENKNLEDILKF